MNYYRLQKIKLSNIKVVGLHCIIFNINNDCLCFNYWITIVLIIRINNILHFLYWILGAWEIILIQKHSILYLNTFKSVMSSFMADMPRDRQLLREKHTSWPIGSSLCQELSPMAMSVVWIIPPGAMCSIGLVLYALLQCRYRVEHFQRQNLPQWPYSIITKFNAAG